MIGRCYQTTESFVYLASYIVDILSLNRCYYTINTLLVITINKYMKFDIFMPLFVCGQISMINPLYIISVYT